MLNPEIVKQCKQALINQKNRLTKQLHAYRQMEQINNEQRTSELSQYDNHPADTGSELVEREKDRAIYQHTEKQLMELQHALAAILDGTYGKCVICHQEIAAKRLLALPTTTRCITHAVNNVPHQRTSEASTLNPNIDVTYEAENAAMFDREDSWQQVEQYGSSDGPSDFYHTPKDYNHMYYHSEEPVGSVEDIEAFLLADIQGKYIGIDTRREYEGFLDE